MAILKKWHGKDLQFDGSYEIPTSGEGWLLNYTDVPIQLQFLSGESVTIQVGQIKNWGDANAGSYEPFYVVIANMATGMVSYEYAA